MITQNGGRGTVWIFWHSRAPDVAESEYRARLLAFHELLDPGAIDGFLGSRILRYDALPWLPGAAEVYEDWYFLRDSAALDRLEEAALDARRQISHDNVARLAGTAAAGLYRLRAGHDSAHIRYCHWLNKPAGQRYDEFFGSFGEYDVSSFGLWGRQMVLGPTPEFLLTASHSMHPDAVLTLAPETILEKHGKALRRD